ncbi:hypothetical protein WCP94_003864 [Bilophila wadsworthia]
MRENTSLEDCAAWRFFSNESGDCVVRRCREEERYTNTEESE